MMTIVAKPLLVLRLVLAAAILAYLIALAGAANASPLKPGNGGKLLPSGYFSTKGSQIVDSRGHNVRIASVGWNGVDHLDCAPNGLLSVNYRATMNAMVLDGFNCFRMSWTDAGLHSANVCRDIDYKLNPEMAGLTQMQVVDKIVAYAGKIGLKVILDHHSNEGMFDAPQQLNGLWYDLGPGTDGTDGAYGEGDVGTVTAANFQADWVAVAKRYAGNSTVIGFDLDNEPHIGYGQPYNGENWGKGGPGDIWAMFTNVGNAIEAVDPGVLIICEGLLDVTDKSSNIWWVMDLTHVATKPVVLDVPHKVVYSVHEYPNERNGGGGPKYIARMNEAWGYLVKENIAPVWIGEMGTPTLPNDPDGIGWVNTILPYIDGKDGKQGGPTFRNGRQPVSTDWWFWTTAKDSGAGWGTLTNWRPTIYNPTAQRYTNQLLFK